MHKEERERSTIRQFDCSVVPKNLQRPTPRASGHLRQAPGGTANAPGHATSKGKDVFAPSSPAVIEQDLMNKKIAGSGKVAASWFVIFSPNELVAITTKGNPLGVRRTADLARPEVKFVRVTGEKDLATNRTIDFLMQGAAGDSSRPNTVPDVIRAIKDGKANAGVVYYSAAVGARNDLDIIRFPASVNQSDKIRNAATVPESAENKKTAIDFIMFLLSVDGRKILEETGQPALVSAIRRGAVPSELR